MKQDQISCSSRLTLGFAALLLASSFLQAQELVNWAASSRFKYNLHGSAVVLNPATQKPAVMVIFSVTDPQNGNQPWDIKTSAEFKQPAGLSRLAVDIGWSTSEYSNTGSSGESLQPVPFKTVNGVSSGGGAGVGAALPISIDALKNSTPVASHPGWFMVTADLPSQASHNGIAALEGHPAAQMLAPDGSTQWAPVPVQSAYLYFPITDPQAVARRQVVDIKNCQKCHDGGNHGDTTIPRLSLHGNNRVEELNVCVICHNPSQTDIPYRTAGAEVSVDFKRMIHSIHAGGFRTQPFSVVGFRGTVYDFSQVRFPKELSDCMNCHIEVGGKGTYELPLARSVQGSTIKSGSVPGSFVDVNPANDRKITPTAAVCSSCHDKSEDIRHMTSRTAGGSFSALQSDIDKGRVRERCAECHGPGKTRDVRRVHEIGESSGESDDD